MTMKEGHARIVGDEVDFHVLIATEHDNVFENSGAGFAENPGEFEAVPVKMDGMNIVAGIAHVQAVALAFFQVKDGGNHFAAHGIGDAIDGPAIISRFAAAVTIRKEPARADGTSALRGGYCTERERIYLQRPRKMQGSPS